MKTKNVKKILFITLSNIGDVVLTSPTLLALIKQYKNAKIDVVGDSRSKILFTHCPMINGFYEKDKTKGLLGTISLIRALRKNRYDIAVDLRSDGLLYFIRAKKKFHKVRNNDVHSVVKHLQSIKELSIPHPAIWIGKKNEIEARKILPKKYDKILAIGLGANSSHKIWPAKNYAALCAMLKSSFTLVVLVGNKEDNQFTEHFKKFFDGNVININGVTDLLTTAAILKRAELFIGNDSGLGHIASAVKTKTFTIFGPGEPDRYRPWGAESYWYQNNEKDISKIKPAVIFQSIIKNFGLAAE